jgi:hypothetical protein
MEKKRFLATGLLIGSKHTGIQKQDGEVFSDHADLSLDFSYAAGSSVCCYEFRQRASSIVDLTIKV